MTNKFELPHLTPLKRVLLLLTMVLIGVAIYWAILMVGSELSGQNEEDTANGDGDPIRALLFLFLPMCIAGLIYIPACIWALIRTGQRNRQNISV